LHVGAEDLDQQGVEPLVHLVALQSRIDQPLGLLEGDIDVGLGGADARVDDSHQRKGSPGQGDLLADRGVEVMRFGVGLLDHHPSFPLGIEKASHEDVGHPAAGGAHGGIRPGGNPRHGKGVSIRGVSETKQQCARRIADRGESPDGGQQFLRQQARGDIIVAHGDEALVPGVQVAQRWSRAGGRVGGCEGDEMRSRAAEDAVCRTA